MFLNKKSKFSIGILTIIVLFVFILGNFSYPQTARAQLVHDAAAFWQFFYWDVGINIDKKIKAIKDNIIAATFKRVLQGFFNKLAYDFAVDLAEMGPGKKSLFEGRTMANYVGAAADAAVSTFINDIAKGTIGLDLCKPKNPKLKIQLQFSLYDTHLDPDFNEPDCSLQEMGEKWGKLYNELSKDWGKLVSLNEQDLAGIGFEGDSANQARIKLAQSMLDPKQGDIGFVSTILREAQEEKAKKEQEARDEKKKIEGQDGLKPPQDTITQDDKGSVIVEQEKLKGIHKTWAAVTEFTGDPFADVANIFLNTFTQKLMERIIREMFTTKPGPTEYEDVTLDGGVIPFVGEGFSAKDYIDQIFSQINKLSYNMGSTNIDVISEMEVDLRGEGIAGLMNNGAIDADFSQALREAQLGEPLTVEEAMTRYGWQNKWFGYSTTGSNPQQPVLENGFSYDNMKKLRKNRVIPVGWEMAALKIKQFNANINGCSPGYGCTLETVLNHYGKTGTYIENGEEKNNNYCGWRPIGLEPYNINITDSNTCNAVLDNIMDVEVEWRGSDAGNNIPGYCNKYEINANGFINAIIRDDSDINDMVDNKEECEGGIFQTQPTSDYFYEWEPGGCMIKELDEGKLCGLVNPDWVLKAPVQQCGAKGYYSALSSPDSADRYQECADVKHCINEDENGNCLGTYDYCTKEENIWKFKGNSCSDYYSSCLTLKDDQGQIESYLTDTLKGCDESQVGCRDYLTEKELVDDFYEWKINGDKVYLNNNAGECDNEDSGCTEFIEIKPGVNLIPNSSFEIDENDDDIPDGWKFNNAGADFSLTTNQHQFGINSLKYNNVLVNSYFYQYVNIPSRGLYTLSYYVKGNGSVNPKLKIGDDVPYIVVSNDDAKFDSGGIDISGWQRKTGYFSILDDAGNAHDDSEVRKHILFEVKGEVYIDGIQFELNSLEYSDVHEGEGSPGSYKKYAENGKSYIKKAPDYYHCDTNFIDECNDFAKYCSAADIGCELYAPVNGDPFVPAVLKSNDLCVQECNNYQTFVENPSYFDNLEAMEEYGTNASTTDKNFIADTAKDCPAGEASCELFTNIDALERGAEAKEYYSFIRQCVKPDDDGVITKLFYTWEGSDTSAFQLKTWKLLESGIDDIFNYDSAGNPLGGHAPCTNIEIGKTTCLDNATNVVTCTTTDNFDCRTFYDENAIPHNRLLSKTIPITEECINLRRENSNQIYKTAPSMSRACSASNVGCLAYEGNNSNNIRNVFGEEFELLTISGWMAEDGDGSQINTQHSNESIYYNGHSMKTWVATNNEEIILSYNLTQNFDISAQDIKNKKYSLGFWAKSFGNNNGETSASSLYTGSEDNFIDFDQGMSVASPGWLFYKYNPIAISSINNGDVILKFKVKINNNVGQNNDGFYIDNIILKEISSDFYKIKGSWNTPRICSDNSYLGCQQYKDRYANDWYIYQFSDLCAEENIGCTAMIDTQNSSMPFQQTFNAFCGVGSPLTECDLGKYYYKNVDDILGGNIDDSTIIVPKDELVYIVKDKDYSCFVDEKGCDVLGAKNNDGNYDSFYKINDPDKYIPYDYYGGLESTLCLDEDKNCTVFSVVNGSGVIYKIHPRDLTCTYQDDPQNNIGAGFYTDDGQDCTGLLYNINYDNLTSSVAEDWKPFHDYTGGYAALCENDQSKCSLFIDPVDNQSVEEYLYADRSIVLNLKDHWEWRRATWDKDYDVDDNYGKFQGPGAGEEPSHLGIVNDVEDGSSIMHVTFYNDSDLLVYSGFGADPNEFYNFFVEEGEIYRLSAFVKLRDTESISTFLSCKTSTDNNDYLYLNDDNNKIPYALPSIASKYYTDENFAAEEWQYIYGYYKLLPGVNYCNIAFRRHGNTNVEDANMDIKDIVFERAEGRYNYIDNDNLDRESCNAPDLENGCVLFNNTTDPNLTKSSLKAYGYADEGANDSNTLLKVVRDRECSKWVTCGASLRTFNQEKGQFQNSCVSLVGCDDLSESGSGLCSHPFSSGLDAKPLTLDHYLNMRGKGRWSDNDYSGYSIPGLYPLDSLLSIEKEEDVYILGHLIMAKDEDNDIHIYKTNIGMKSSSILGNNWVYNNWLGTTDKRCRLYREQNSPFPWTNNNDIVLQIDRDDVGETIGGGDYVLFKEKTSNFKNANICQPNFQEGDIPQVIDSGDCECHYITADYGTEKLFYPYDYDIDDIPTSVAPSYSYDKGDMNLMKLKSISKNLGWKGFCLEDDDSLLINNTNVINAEHRCLSWYPVDIISGEMDAYAVNPASSVSSLVGENSKLCFIGEDYKLKYDRIYCDELDGDICKSYLVVGAGSVMSAGFDNVILDFGLTCADVLKRENFLDMDPYGRGTEDLGVSFELRRTKFAKPTNYNISRILGDEIDDADKTVYQLNLSATISVGSDEILENIFNIVDLRKCYNGSIMRLTNRPKSFMTIDGNAFTIYTRRNKCLDDCLYSGDAENVSALFYVDENGEPISDVVKGDFQRSGRYCKKSSGSNCNKKWCDGYNYYIPAMHPGSPSIDWKDEDEFGMLANNVFISSPDATTGCCEQITATSTTSFNFRCLTEEQITEVADNCIDHIRSKLVCSLDSCTGDIQSSCHFIEAFNRSCGGTLIDEGKCTGSGIPMVFINVFYFRNCYICEEATGCEAGSTVLIDNFFTNYGSRKALLYINSDDKGLINRYKNSTNNIPNELNNLGLDLDDFYPFFDFWKDNALLTLNLLWNNGGIIDTCDDDWKNNYSDDTFITDAGCGNTEPDPYGDDGRKDPERNSDCWVRINEIDSGEQAINDGWFECALIRELRSVYEDVINNNKSICDILDLTTTTLSYYDNNGIRSQVEVALNTPVDTDFVVNFCENIGWMNALFDPHVQVPGYTIDLIENNVCPGSYPLIPAGEDNYVKWLKDQIKIGEEVSLPSDVHNWCANYYTTASTNFNYNCIFGDGCIKACQTYADLDNVLYNSNNFYLNWLAPSELTGDDPCTDYYCPTVLTGHIDAYGDEVSIRFGEIASTTANFYDTVHEPFSANYSEGNLRNPIHVFEERLNNNFNDFYSITTLAESMNKLGGVIIRVPDENFMEYKDSNEWERPAWAHSPWWDNTLNGFDTPPVINRVGGDAESGFYEGLAGISINNEPIDAHIIATNGSLDANLSFYAYAEVGQAPLDRVEIYWTGIEESKLILEGPFENHKHDCIRQCGTNYKQAFLAGESCIDNLDCEDGEKCFAETWGDLKRVCIEDNAQTTEDGFFSYTYLYTCNSSSYHWRSDCFRYGQDGGCCIYEPRVKVIDSWGIESEASFGNCSGRPCAIIVLPR